MYRERETETDRQTDRQTETERERDREGAPFAGFTYMAVSGNWWDPFRR